MKPTAGVRLLGDRARALPEQHVRHGRELVRVPGEVRHEPEVRGAQHVPQGIAARLVETHWEKKLKRQRTTRKPVSAVQRKLREASTQTTAQYFAIALHVGKRFH